MGESGILQSDPVYSVSIADTFSLPAVVRDRFHCIWNQFRLRKETVVKRFAHCTFGHRKLHIAQNEQPTFGQRSLWLAYEKIPLSLSSFYIGNPNICKHKIQKKIIKKIGPCQHKIWQ